MNKFIGRVVGGLLTEKALALWCFAGNPIAALIWAIALALA